MPISQEDISKEAQIVRTKSIMSLLTSWNISAKDQINLLGLPASVKARHLQHFHKDKVLPQTKEIDERINHLFGIADALRTSYPHNELMAALWLTTKHRRFENQTPLKTMLNKAIPGLIAVRSHLDCAFDWEQDHKK